jgi:hypothetical protein
MQVIRPGASGGDVPVLFQALAERGLIVDAREIVSGTYGPTSQAAVQDFQAKHGLRIDDIVGPSTWAALQSAIDTSVDISAPIFSTAGLSPYVTKLLDVAHAEYRRPVLEQPPGSNHGDRVDLYLRGHDNADWLVDERPTGPPWCGRFARWCVIEAARSIGASSPVENWGDLASALKWVARGKNAGRFWQMPTVGSIGCILTDGHGHLVIVAAKGPSNSLITLEGNSGNRVALRSSRTVGEFVGFVNVAP